MAKIIVCKNMHAKYDSAVSSNSSVKSIVIYFWLCLAKYIFGFGRVALQEFATI